MRRRYVIVGTVCFALVAAGLGGWQQSRAAEANAAKLREVAASCDRLKLRLQAAEKADTAVRIKRGRTYDRELLPYISAFNSRVAANKVDAPELISITAELQDAAGPNGFGRLYSLYADDLENAIRSDCKANPAETYGWIEKARVDRAALAEQVGKIDRLTAAYTEELKSLQGDFKPAINAERELPR